jgi:hypothetical protein
MKTEKVREKYGLISKGTTVIKRLLNMAGGNQVRHPECNEGSDFSTWKEVLREVYPELNI